jgi:uncharacterized RDD family membrane protein YckC
MTQPPDWSSQNQAPGEFPPPGTPPGYAPPPGYTAPPGPPPQAPPPGPGYGYGMTQSPASVPAGMYFDQLSGLMLPVGVTLAPIGRRIGAYFLAIPLAIVTLGIGYIIWGLIIWGRGQTPAQSVLGMRCWRPETGRVATWGTMALREIVGYIVEDILSVITQIISFILMLTRKDRQCLHDLIAGTVVVYDPNKVLAPPSAK